MPTIIDSYSESNQDNYQFLSAGNYQSYGQAFTGDGQALDSANFFLMKIGSPTGNGYVKVYTPTGTFGTNAKPTGAALATSDAFDVSTLTGSYALATLNFTGANRITLGNGTKYIVGFEYGGGDGANGVRVGYDASSATHGGNACSYFPTTWYTHSAVDTCFYVYGEPAPAANVLRAPAVPMQPFLAQ